MMINSPNKVGFRTSTAASRIISSLDFTPPAPPWEGGEMGGWDVPDAVLDHDDRAVHDHPEIERAQAEEAGGDAEPQHAREGEHHRQRYRQRDDRRCPQIAEKKK